MADIVHVTALETTGHPLEVPWSTVHREAAKGDTTVPPPTPTDATVDIGDHADRPLVGEWTTVVGTTPTGLTIILLEYQEVGAMVQVKGVAIALFQLSSRGTEKPGLSSDTILLFLLFVNKIRVTTCKGDSCFFLLFFVLATPSSQS